MHPDLERQRFLDHIKKLRAEIDEYATGPKEAKQRLAEYRCRIDRLEAQNAVLRARLTAASDAQSKVELLEAQVRDLRAGIMVDAVLLPRPPAGGGCRHPNTGMGSLTYDQLVDLHRRQVDQAQICAMAGVSRPSLSRWRKANNYVQAWMKRHGACGSASSPTQEDIESDHVVAQGRDDGQAVPGIAVRESAT